MKGVSLVDCVSPQCAMLLWTWSHVSGHQCAPVDQVSMHNDVMSESRDDDCIMTWDDASRPMRTMIILLMTTHYNYYNYYMHITPPSYSPQ